MRLFEIMTSALPWEWKSIKRDSAIARFSSRHDYQTVFHKLPDESTFVAFDTMGNMDGELTNENIGPTILSTVMEIMVDYNAKMSPSALTMFAKESEPNRVHVYRKLLQRYANSYNYTVEENSEYMMGMDVIRFTIHPQ